MYLSTTTSTITTINKLKKVFSVFALVLKIFSPVVLFVFIVVLYSHPVFRFSYYIRYHPLKLASNILYST